MYCTGGTFQRNSARALARLDLLPGLKLQVSICHFSGNTHVQTYTRSLALSSKVK